MERVETLLIFGSIWIAFGNRYNGQKPREMNISGWVISHDTCTDVDTEVYLNTAMFLDTGRDPDVVYLDTLIQVDTT